MNGWRMLISRCLSTSSTSSNSRYERLIKRMLTFAVFLVACRNNYVCFFTPRACAQSHTEQHIVPQFEVTSHTLDTHTHSKCWFKRDRKTHQHFYCTYFYNNSTKLLTHTVWNDDWAIVNYQRRGINAEHNVNQTSRSFSLSRGMMLWCMNDIKCWFRSRVSRNHQHHPSHCCEQNKLTLHSFRCDYNFVFVFHLQKQLKGEWNWCRRHGECTNDKHWTFVTVQKRISIALQQQQQPNNRRTKPV